VSAPRAFPPPQGPPHAAAQSRWQGPAQRQLGGSRGSAECSAEQENGAPFKSTQLLNSASIKGSKFNVVAVCKVKWLVSQGTAVCNEPTCGKCWAVVRLKSWHNVQKSMKINHIPAIFVPRPPWLALTSSVMAVMVSATPPMKDASSATMATSMGNALAMMASRRGAALGAALRAVGGRRAAIAHSPPTSIRGSHCKQQRAYRAAGRAEARMEGRATQRGAARGTAHALQAALFASAAAMALLDAERLNVN
jgi:hypothetical protein